MKRKMGPSPMLLPMPAVLVGSYAPDGTPDAMTAAWAAACCAKPPCLGVAVRHSRATFEHIEARGGFTINVPTGSQAVPVDYLGMVSFHQDAEKLRVAGLTTVPGGAVDAPLIVECPINVECAVRHRLDIGSHAWIVGEVLEVHVDEELVDEGGKLRIDALDPLVYVTSRGDYHALGQRLAAAYSAGNDLKKKG